VCLAMPSCTSSEVIHVQIERTLPGPSKRVRVPMNKKKTGIAVMLGASGGVFIGAVTILTNVAVYAGFVALVLLVRKIFGKAS
jgi:hypothetical protein